MSHTAILSGEILKDVATGQQYKLNPSEKDLQEGLWEYHPQADGGNWHFIIKDGIKYAVNEFYIDWDEDDVQVWSPNEMGQWPFGNQLSEEEVFMREMDDVLFYLDCYLESELEWMDALEDLENEVPEDVDSDVDETSEDEGYNTSPEVDFDLLDYWALVLNSFLWKIDLYKEGEDGYWTL